MAWPGTNRQSPIPFSATNQPSVRPASVMQSTLVPTGSLMTCSRRARAVGELVEQLTVPGEARSGSAAEVLARQRQDVAPAWFRPGNTDCNGGRSSSHPGNQKPTITRSGCHFLLWDLHLAGRPKRHRGVFATPFFCHTHLIQAGDHRCASENVNRAAVSSVDGWIFEFLTNKSREWLGLHWSVARGSIIFVWLKLMTAAGQGPARCSTSACCRGTKRRRRIRRSKQWISLSDDSYHRPTTNIHRLSHFDSIAEYVC